MDGVWGLDIVQTEEGIVGSSNHGDPCDNSLLTTGGSRGLESWQAVKGFDTSPMCINYCQYPSMGRKRNGKCQHHIRQL
ncbi:hypothetical protein LguiB_021887 [Lonicera macranthoides]